MRSPNTKELERFRRMVEIGCLCCLELGFYNIPEIHHILRGGRRISHLHTLNLCPWHHRSVSPDPKQSRALFGPSLADGSKPFVEFWGTEMSLLERVNGLMCSSNAKTGDA